MQHGARSARTGFPPLLGDDMNDSTVIAILTAIFVAVNTFVSTMIV